MFAFRLQPRLLARGSVLLRARVQPQPLQTEPYPRRDRPSQSSAPRLIAALNTTSAPWLLRPPLSPAHERGLDDWRGAVASSSGVFTRHEAEPDTGHHVSNWNVANAVTVGRIVAAPVLAHCIVSESYDAALAVLLYAGASDWLDGQLARRLDLRTKLGSYLDPLADKLLVSCATVSLACNDVLPAWLALLIVSRDAALVAGGVALLRPRLASVRGATTRSFGDLLAVAHRIEPLFVSKVNTALQISLAVTAVVSASDWNFVSAETVSLLGNATAVTTVTSGAMYARAFVAVK